MERRELLRIFVAIGASGAISSCGPSITLDSSPVVGSAGKYFDEEAMTFVMNIAQAIIPKTDTGGAIEAGVPQRLDLLLADWADDEYRDQWRGGLVALTAELSSGEVPYQNLSEDLRISRLAELDAAVFSGERTDIEFFKEFKKAACAAYYMSELGATEELAYDPIPGEWQACIEISPADRAWANSQG